MCNFIAREVFADVANFSRPQYRFFCAAHHEGVCWSIAVACILALIVNLGKPHGTRLAFGPYLVAGGLTVCCMQR